MDILMLLNKLRVNILFLTQVSILCILILTPTLHASAQDTPEGPVYIVEEGDTLWSISIKFGVPISELQAVNNLGNNDQITIGDQIIIPGFEDVQGVIVTRYVPLGETLRSLSRKNQLAEEDFRKLNRLTSPAEPFVGSFLILPEQGDNTAHHTRTLLSPGQTLLELAVLNDKNPWNLVSENQLNSKWHAISGEVYFTEEQLGSVEVNNTPGALPEEITSIQIEPESPGQGKTSVIEIFGENGLDMHGTFMGREMDVFSSIENTYYTIQGIHAMADPGVYPIEVEGINSDGAPFGFSQSILISVINYPFDRPLTVDPATIDPAVTEPENAEWTQLATPVTPDKLWQGSFILPSPLEQDYCLATGDCWSSRYGNRRSYNGSAYDSFHTGLDIVGRNGTEIYAPAAGIVVFAGPMTVRGNATMINHGWGIYSAYMHQDEILVDVGDQVEQGQLIGLVGATGRVEGPHLHWEIWAGGVQVDPLEWLINTFPK